MNKPKFAPGPWRRTAGVGGDEVAMVAGMHGTIASVHYAGSLETSLANAHLLAAAPSLYATCVAALAYLDPEMDSGIVSAIRSVLAQARGEE